jgi:serine/threonine protein kinase
MQVAWSTGEWTTLGVGSRQWVHAPGHAVFNTASSSHQGCPASLQLNACVLTTRVRIQHLPDFCQALVLECKFMLFDNPHAHLHRDIKLSNFLIDPRDGSLRLCDFGCAAPVTPQAPSSGQSGQVMGGTAWAMSPQRLQGLDDGPAGDW